MASVPRVFVDTSVLFAALWSESGGSRLMLKLGEAGVVHILVSRHVLSEAEGVMRRKVPELLPLFSLLLERCGAEIAPAASERAVARLEKAVDHAGDARVAADAEKATAVWLVTLDKAHLLGNRRLASAAPYTVGTPGDFLAWLRQSLA